MLDTSKIGHQFPPYNIDIEKGRLRMFANAIGETNPIYTDEAAAVAAGYTSLPAPPTFLRVVGSEGPVKLPAVSLLEVDIGNLLHGTQDFDYYLPICAGDTITASSHIADIYDKKGGALDFIVTEANFTNQHGDLVARETGILVVRNNMGGAKQ